MVHCVVYTEGVRVGAERFCLEPPSGALPLMVYILAPQPTLRRCLDSVEGKQAMRALTIAMNASWRSHPDPAMAARMTGQATDLRAALYGEQNAAYVHAQSMADSCQGQDARRPKTNFMSRDKILLMMLAQVLRLLF